MNAQAPAKHTRRLCIRIQAGIGGMGTGSSVWYHSPLKALISHLLSSGNGTSARFRTKSEVRCARILTIKDNFVRIVERNSMVRIGENVHVVIFDPSKVQLIQQRQ